MNENQIFENGTKNGADFVLANETAEGRGPVSDAELHDFAHNLDQKIYAHQQAQYPNCPANWTRISYEKGRKFARIVANHGSCGSRYAFAFVDLTNGAILKTDGWSKPAKHARGNIRSGDASNWFNHALTVYVRLRTAPPRKSWSPRAHGSPTN